MAKRIMDFRPFHIWVVVYAINGDGPLVDFIELHKQVNNAVLPASVGPTMAPSYQDGLSRVTRWSIRRM